VVYLLSVVLVQHLLLLCPKTRGDKAGLVEVDKTYEAVKVEVHGNLVDV
jgi:hypothetical protein